MAALQDAAIRYEPTGLQHGTVSAIIDNMSFEITTLRIDTDHNGRHAVVEFTSNWELDAARRDLSFNAMNMTMDGTVTDFFNGISDLKSETASFVGDADQRIKEDFLRIMRYFRFQGKFKNPTWDADTLAAIKQNAAGLDEVSGERIWAEMKKILSVSTRKCVMFQMKKHGVVSMHLGKYEAVNDGNFDPVTAMASMIENTDSLYLMKDWLKFNREEMRQMKFLLGVRNKKLTMHNFSCMIADPKVNTGNVFALARNRLDASDLHALLTNTVNVFPVSGDDLMALGIAPGKIMGDTLGRLRKMWEMSMFTDTKETLLAVAK
jgi:tRNA nucleotidyltransferase (CCA-adding enzyme)